MSIHKFSIKSFEKIPVVGILRNHDLETCLKVAEVYFNAGFSTLEITMNTVGFEEIMKALLTKFPSLNIGAGTVLTLNDLEKAIESGASFIVTPVVNKKIIKACVKMGIPIFPGAYTPSEIYKAWSLGATAVKVFPATQLGVSFIKDLKGPLAQIKLLPTGGIAKENIKSFFDAGVFGVGMGSSLLPKAIINDKDYKALEKHLLAIKKEMQ